ncbi:MAG: hypothetical protein AB2L14_34555 [Candidatus Xenobiia bacterium LiM19]
MRHRAAHLLERLGAALYQWDYRIRYFHLNRNRLRSSRLVQDFFEMNVQRVGVFDVLDDCLPVIVFIFDALPELSGYVEDYKLGLPSRSDLSLDAVNAVSAVQICAVCYAYDDDIPVQLL